MSLYTQDQLSDAFDLVAPKTHWKDPINAVVKADAVLVVVAAIRHFTGTDATISLYGAHALVTAMGYRAGPCGDH